MEQREKAKGSNDIGVTRRPYMKPRIVESGAFEHLVLMCAQVDGTFACRTNVTS